MKKTEIFMISKIISKLGVKDVKGENTTELGSNLITSILSNLWMAEQEADIFLASYLAKPLSEIKTMDGVEYLEAFESALKDESLVNFIKRVFKGLGNAKSET